ncbi:tetratricopeptide repeat protein [Shewanella youngdeokensis]|uniref:Tetratricopeptide repeat protein n=1 Tax=Shewanella youngdeokensis TaxID=2999068 RepID=A0ABZ0JXD5_9GAMM|nr:tetratricopeptide repeat protein [Shewanella sp. DAU334]
MRIVLTLCLVVLSFCSQFNAHATGRDPIETERLFREHPNQLRHSINQHFPKTPNFISNKAIHDYAVVKGMSDTEAKFELLLHARLSLDLSSKSADRYTVARKLIDQLAMLSSTPFEKSYVQMLNGRYVGRSKQDYKTAVNLYQGALNTLANTHGVKEQVLRFTINEHLSMLHMMMHEHDVALQHLQQAKLIATKLASPYFSASAESALGKYYYKKNRYAESLQHYSIAINHTDSQKNPVQDAHIKLQLARVYRNLKSWDEALQYANEAAELFKRTDNEAYLSSCMTVIAMIYAEQDLWNKAIDYYLNAQQIDAKQGHYIGQALNLHNLGEAYFKVEDPQASISHLMRANKIFNSRGSKHYLVYNHLLIAEVHSSIADWSTSLQHAYLAADLAKEMNLNNEQIEALTLSSQALKQLKQFEQAYNDAQKIINLRVKTNEPESDKQRSETSLQLHKVKLELNQANNALQIEQSQHSIYYIALVICTLLILMLAALALYLRISQKKLAIEQSHLQQKNLLDPLSKLPNYSAFAQTFPAAINTIKTLALVSLTEQLNSDLAQGHECNAKMNTQQLNALTAGLHCQTFFIRPGLFLLCIDKVIAPETLLSDVRQVLTSEAETTVHMGMLSLPLLADTEVKLSAKQHFGTLQMMLSGAMSLGNQQDYYVTFKPLDFAPAAMFVSPLYLTLEKSVIRGLIKLETNGVKDDIIWPRWKRHQNIDLGTQ